MYEIKIVITKTPDAYLVKWAFIMEARNIRIIKVNNSF